MSEETLDIVGKRTLEYVFVCLGRFNGGTQELTLRALGGNITKGVEVAQILQTKLGVEIKSSKISKLRLHPRKGYPGEIPCLTMDLKYSPKKGKKKAALGVQSQFGFVNFPIYHLIFDWLLANGAQLDFHTFLYKHSDPMREDPPPFLSVTSEGGNVIVKINEDVKVDEYFFDHMKQAFYRCGLIVPDRWQEIVKKLSEYDDIILGLDTNMIYNCTISEHILPVLSLVNFNEYVHTPNWILTVVPGAVMHEMEEAVNIRQKGGFLLPQGRMGFRGLQEILELSQATDLPGISLIIAGGANPAFDTKTEIKALREDFIERAKAFTTDGSKDRQIRSFKSSSGDMIIRDQFKKFLRQTDFHKGTFFLTADKSNVALSRAEGLHALYVHSTGHFIRKKMEIRPPRIELEEGKDINLVLPIGKLIYEMAVQFENVVLKWNDSKVQIGADLFGKEIDTWLQRSVFIKDGDLEHLIGAYKGSFNLAEAQEIWDELYNKFLTLSYT